MHPAAIREVLNIDVAFSDHDPVVELVAQQLHLRDPTGNAWNDLSHRARKRLTYQAKKSLNTLVVEQMTPALLAERDPQGEVISWLRAMDELAS